VKEPNNSIYSATSLALRVIFVRHQWSQIYMRWAWRSRVKELNNTL